MHFTSTNILSVVSIIFYSPISLFSVFLCTRHGFSPNKGFIFLIFFSLIRISGSAVNLASTHASPRQAGIMNTAALVLSFTGLSPLLLATLGLVYHVRFGMVKIYPTTLKPVHLVLLRVPVMAGLVLCDEGAIEYGARVGATGDYIVPITSKVGVVVFMVVSVATGAIIALLFRFRHRLDESDQYVLYAVAASMPFVFARVIYGFLGAYTPDTEFGFFKESVLLMGCMSALPEMIVVIIYTILGIVLPPRVDPPLQETTKQEKRKTKIVLVKPWKVVDAEASSTTIDNGAVDAGIDRMSDVDDVDDASIRGRDGEDSRKSGEESYVPPGTRESVAGQRFLGTMHADYLPPLILVDSAIVFDKVEYG
ncbi:hypothetical protein VTL71DRAFT_14848 [Oculimacula yallundae]|uniref:DUF7702 domain-containing protein n=1 Tax=Oculimacula yallundae TaxID=86028 RepID=A0ABR4CG73_9HELO